MKLYRETFYLFWKNKHLWIVLIAYIVLNLVQIYMQAEPGSESSLLDHTRQLLLLCPQILVLYLILSYEFFSQQHRANLEESMRATGQGFANQPAVAQAGVMISILFLNYLVFVGFDLMITHIVEDVDALCNQIMIMNGGKMVFNGPAKSLKAVAEHKTFECKEAELEQLTGKYYVERQFEQDDEIRYRFVADKQQSCQMVNPRIEDGYICVLEEI